MKKFLLRSAVLLLAVAAVMGSIGAAYRSTTYWKNIERTEDIEKFREMPETITFAVFGPSHARFGFRDSDWGEGFFNFAMAAQPPQYDLMLMREYADKIAPGATVVLTVTYLSPFWPEDEALFSSRKWSYYHILSPENITDCDTKYWCLARFAPELTTDVRQVLGAFLKPPELQPTYSDTYGYMVFTPDKLDEERNKILTTHLRGIELCFPDGNPVQEQALDEMLSLCRENGWNPVLVTIPYQQVYNDCFPDEVYEVVRGKTRALADAYGVTWLDYSHDPDFADKMEYYMDIDHPNYAGATAIAEKLQPALRELGLWE